MAIINIPAPAGSGYAGQLMMQPWQQLGQAIGTGLGQKKLRQMSQEDIDKLRAYSQYQQQLRQAQALQQQLATLPLEQRQAYQGPAPQWPAYQELPVMRTPAYQQMQAEAMLGQALGLGREQRPLTIDQMRALQAQRVNAVPGTPEFEAIAEGPQAPQAQWSSVQVAGLQNEAGLPEGTAYQQKTSGEIKILNRPSPKDVQTPEEKQTVETGMRKEFDSITKDYRAVRDSYGRVLAAGNVPSPAGDLALIFNYMKILDPGSVVRESEFANAAATGAYGEQMKAAALKIITGQRLSEAMRKDFMDRAKRLYRSQEQIYTSTERRYIGLAKRYGIDPQNIVAPIYDFGEKTDAPASPGMETTVNKYLGL